MHSKPYECDSSQSEDPPHIHTALSQSARPGVVSDPPCSGNTATTLRFRQRSALKAAMQTHSFLPMGLPWSGVVLYPGVVSDSPWSGSKAASFHFRCWSDRRAAALRHRSVPVGPTWSCMIPSLEQCLTSCTTISTGVSRKSRHADRFVGQPASRPVSQWLPQFTVLAL